MLSFSSRFDDAIIKSKLRQLSRSIDDMSPVFQEITAVLADETDQAFEDEKDPSEATENWPDLAEETKEERRKIGKWPGQILQRTQGGLKPSISTDFDKQSAAIGSNKMYAAVHQYGATIKIPSKKSGLVRTVDVPARPYLGISKIGEADILDIVDDYLRETLANKQ